MIRDTFKGIAYNLNNFVINKTNYSRKLFDSFALPVIGIDTEGVVVYNNTKAQEYFGKNINELSQYFSTDNSISINTNIYVKKYLWLNKNISFYILVSDNHSMHLHSYSIPYVVLDARGVIIESNKLFRELLKVNKKKVQDDFYAYLDQISANLLMQSFKTNNVNIEVKFNTDDNLTVLLCRLYKDNNNYFHYFLVDITEYKNLEMHLIHSQKMQAIGQLAGGIAHDFNNLLTAMLGFCDLLLIKHPAGDPSFAEIMQIKQNSNRAANLVRQLLAISRKQVLKPEVLDISDLIEELIYLIRRLVGEKITLNITHGKGLGLVKVDQGQLEQVLINLVVNARDAIFANGDSGTISISTENIEITKTGKVEEGFVPSDSNEPILSGDYVLIEVSDTGIGMTKATISKIFEPFFSTKELGAGTGLGLSTVYGIVKQTGGYLYVNSKKNKGTRFHVYLKVSNDNEVGDGKMLQDTENKLIKQDLTGDATILLVEDEVPVRMFSASALSNKGYNIIEADNGEAGLEVIKKRGKEIDIIITDVIMPGLNGPDFIAEVHKIYPKTKVIFMSGYAEEAFSENYTLEGDLRFNFLSKPFTLKQLASKVKEVLQED